MRNFRITEFLKLAFTEDLSIVTSNVETAGFYKSLRTMPWEQPQSLQGDSPPKAIRARVKSFLGLTNSAQSKQF